MRLPEDFMKRMEADLGDEYPAFLACFSEKSHQGLRVNELKISREDFLKLPAAEEFQLKPVPWCPTGFYYGTGALAGTADIANTSAGTADAANTSASAEVPITVPATLGINTDEIRPGRHVLHEAGAYYIQEPSAMSAAALLDAQPGERILDLCAAPGGKSSQIASAMQGEGLLVVNEIHPQRAKILSQNMERMGVRNVLVTNEDPAGMAAHFPEYFDKILCDAPCSGEGMFRKDDTAVMEWSLAHVDMCADRQKTILREVYKMLKPGGRLIYSTCTFAEEENEQVAKWMMEEYPDMKPDESVEAPWFAKGKVEGVFRLWPHKMDGEGHGVTALRKEGEIPEDVDYIGTAEKTIPWKDRKKLAAFHAFETEALKEPFGGDYIFYGEQLYRVPEGCPNLKGLKCLRPGLKIGEQKGKVFKPDHALAMALRPDEVKNVLNLNHEDALRYLHGETVECPDKMKGWSLVCTDGVSIGWGKASGGMMKNHYPKGLRIMY